MRYAFIAGDTGDWRILSSKAVRGPALGAAQAVELMPANQCDASQPAAWALHGVVSNLRYATRDEVTALQAVQEKLGRPAARRAALIPIKKTAAWWALAQDERRAIFETDSRHTAIGLEYLPAIARQLFHARDIGEPFDFLTWFEYAPEHAQQFEDLVARLRSSREWNFVAREVDIRLERV